jgi:hypothetical protein
MKARGDSVYAELVISKSLLFPNQGKRFPAPAIKFPVTILRELFKKWWQDRLL